MADRPKALKYNGQMQDFGTGRLQPDQWLSNIPARDLTEQDIRLFTDDDMKMVLAARRPDGTPLYSEGEPPPPKDPLDDMTMTELRDHAIGLGIEVPGSIRSKEAMRELIAAQEVEAAKPETHGTAAVLAGLQPEAPEGESAPEGEDGGE